MDTAAGPGLQLAPHAVLLRRSSIELQVGVDPSVVVPDRYAGVLRALAKGCLPGPLEQTARDLGLQPTALPELLAALEGANLLQLRRAAAGRAVRVVGAGPLGSRTAHELAAAGFATVYLADLPARAPAREGGGRSGRRTAAPTTAQPARVELLAAALAEAQPRVRVRRTRHFSKPEGGAVALTVVVADGPEPDRLVPDLLREHGAAHLLVRCSGDEAVVGPLVVPGVTSCVRCADLARRDADPRWPGLLEQLTGVRIEPAPTLLAWAAVSATVQALAFLGPSSPETLGHTLELGGERHMMRLRAWAVHPQCPCRWAGAAAPVSPEHA